ncbi:iron chelate uptake ABC transporter family permease subunit [Actinomadura bangladeshensis]|uniref:Iron chelate uptake ABC transporter family permease subunit n=1 Tax=Actinomadura bangladeshensis TaxID=453573 RepID=A0A6L9QRZ8_9ACTN|nr:iron chelate uptake ABC transporter family permease subunit [Actinomadura bangladeshensis]NEA28260.1 iron chelate uptake ABC transporter family permease subunit [Actinomadura bangladeshensis]
MSPARTAPPRPPVKGGRASRRLWLPVLAAVLLATVVASLAIGAGDVPFGRVLPGVLSPDGGSRAELIVHELRLPRTLLGVAVGMALGLAGAVMQALTRNPLAEPGLLGVNGGAALAVVLVIGATRVDDVLVYVWAAFAGAAGAAALVYMIGARGRGGASPARLVLAGAAVNAVFSAMTAGVMLLAPGTFNGFRFWQVGSLGGREMSVFYRVLPFVLVGTVLALALARPLNALAMGDDAGRALGSRPGRTRALGALAVVLLCGSATAAAGPIWFLGLAVPFIVRTAAGPDQRLVLPYSLLLAPVLLLGADIIGRVVTPGELETGIVTAFLGAPLFAVMVRRGRTRDL